MKNHFIKSIFAITSITFIVLGLYSCSKKEAANPIVLGNEYQGGFIFYIDNTGQHGLVAYKMPTDIISQGWGCYFTDMPSTSETFGQGKNNTTYILSHCSEPNIWARQIDNLSVAGYSDWYMPSLEEVQLIYDNLHKQGKGGFVNHTYWTSTEHSPSYAWEIDFGNGTAQRGSKGNTYQYAIAIRAF